MGCGCTKSSPRSSVAKAHVYVDSKGKETEYPSEIQARAAQVRAGGSGTVKPR